MITGENDMGVESDFPYPKRKWQNLAYKSQCKPMFIDGAA
jgi:hypothetical protein